MSADVIRVSMSVVELGIVVAIAAATGFLLGVATTG